MVGSFPLEASVPVSIRWGRQTDEGQGGGTGKGAEGVS
jgi:hypothetical protein